MNAVKMFAAHGSNGVVSVSFQVSDVTLDWGTLKGNATIRLLMTDGETVGELAMVRGTLRTFNNSGDSKMDFTNSSSAQHPNSGVYGLDDIINVAWALKAYDGLKAKGAKFLNFCMQWDGEKWIKVPTIRAGVQLKLSESASDLLDGALEEVKAVEKKEEKAETKAKAGKAFKKNS